MANEINMQLRMSSKQNFQMKKDLININSSSIKFNASSPYNKETPRNNNNNNEKINPNQNNNNFYTNNYFSNPLNIYEDVNENIRATLRKEIGLNPNADFSLSLERAYLPNEIEFNGNLDEKFDSMGYIEEDSDDNKENIDETFFNSDFNKIIPDAIRDENILENERQQNSPNIRDIKDIKDKRNLNSENNNYNSNKNYLSVGSFPRTPRQPSLQFGKKFSDNLREKETNITHGSIIEEERDFIKSKNELEELLLEKNKSKTIRYNNLIEEVYFNNNNNSNNSNSNSQNEKIIVIKSGQFLIILRYIYDAFHPFLIDLSDQLLIERLKYFEKDNEIYISIIKQYLGLKDRTFNYILEDLINKTNLTEDLLDASFSYYISSTDKNNKDILEINEAYDKLIHADYK